MFHTPAAGALYYRVTRLGTRPFGVLSGMGSYYTHGGRYHRPHQRTVYASHDALVSIIEMAYYQALEWQDRIGGGRTGSPIALPRPAPPAYPLLSPLLRWCFTLAAPPRVIDVDDPIARATFQHTQLEILNPAQAYTMTQSLAERIRTFRHPQHPPPEGIRAPSVRTPATAGHQPSQYALFVTSGRKLRGQISWKADLALEFCDEAGNPVGPNTREVAWTRPRFRLNGLPAPIPAFGQRPGSRALRPGRWYPIEIRSM
jgi:hypothetical protein